MRRNARKQQYTSAFDKNCLLRVQENRQQKKKEPKKRTDKTCLPSSLLPFSFVVCIHLLAPEEDNFVESVRVLLFSCVVLCEYIFLNLFYFVNLNSSCSLIPWILASIQQRWNVSLRTNIVVHHTRENLLVFANH